MFSPRRIGEITLKNGLAVAPMTTTQSRADGSVSDAETRWIERLAEDGYGMIITCAAAVGRTSIAFPQQLSFGDDAFVPGLAELARRASRPGMALVAQLCHGGSRAVPALTGEPAYSASRFELPLPGFVPPLELAIPQIEAIIDDFASAAARAARAGFQGAEFHGANGYLFTQFASTATNSRRDAWGGPLSHRARFAREVVRAARARVPKPFILGMRWTFESPFDSGLDLDEGIQVINWLAEDGIDYGHVSQLDLGAASTKYPGEPAFERIRASVDRALPLMAAGGVVSSADLDRAVLLGADLVAIGRSAIGNRHVPSKLAAGEPLARTPFRRDALAQLGVSDDFVRYISTAPPLASLQIVAE
jgi:2,4-dienoyl-CoA reductase-like NADH-dependent reductase (Old Yellow Enzyme family)